MKGQNSANEPAKKTVPHKTESWNLYFYRPPSFSPVAACGAAPRSGQRLSSFTLIFLQNLSSASSTSLFHKKILHILPILFHKKNQKKCKKNAKKCKFQLTLFSVRYIFFITVATVSCEQVKAQGFKNCSLTKQGRKERIRINYVDA